MKHFFGTLALVVVFVALGWATWWNLSRPIVQLDSETKEVVAVITYDGIVHPPSYMQEAKVEYYTPEYVAPGYRPAKFGITERELKKLK